jgi:uncharacterized membrane protein YjjB (DUF3815 family)
MSFARIIIYLAEGLAITVCFYLITKSQLQDTSLMILSAIMGITFTLLIVLYDQCSGCGTLAIGKPPESPNQTCTP